MADTIINFADAITRKAWSQDLWLGMPDEMEYKYLIGTSDRAVVQVVTDLAKGKGDQITTQIGIPLFDDGIVGRNKVEGNEEALSYLDFHLTIEELNKPVSAGGAMESQRVPWSQADRAKSVLKEWWGRTISNFCINYLCGNAAFTHNGATFAQAATAPDAGHHLFANGAASEAAMTANDIFDLFTLQAALQRARLINKMYNAGQGEKIGYFPIRPILYKGKEYYRVILHDYCFDQLRENFNIGQWGDMKREAGDLGIKDVDIIYQDALITKSPKVYKARAVGTTGGVYRNILCGCQAAILAWGGAGDNKEAAMNLVPYTSDAGRLQNFRAEGIFGIKKTTFSGIDFGVIVMAGYGAPLVA